MLDLHYKKYGTEGEDFIILHGLFGTLDNFHTLATAFGNTYKVWTLDQRNHGKSPHSPHISYPLMADDLAHFMDRHGINKAHILGHSMGGKTAMEFSFHHPDRLLKLIVSDIAPHGYGESHNELISALQGLDLSKVTKRADAEEGLGQKIQSPAVLQFLLKNLAREDSGYRWKMNLPAITANYQSIIGPVDPTGSYNGPTLFMRGLNSDYITDADKPDILTQFPNAEFYDFPGAGHWIHAEAPGPFLTATLEYLKK